MLKKMYNIKIYQYVIIFFMLSMVNGCMSKDEGSGYIGPAIEPERIVFIGIKAALTQGQEPGLFNNPISGAAVRSEPVSQSTADRLSDKMYADLIESKDCEIVNLREIKKLTDPSLFGENVDDGIKIIQSIGKAVSADIAIAGYLYKMHEREGTEYSVETPASAAFDIYLISVKDGTVLWRGSFDKTQKSLSEDLLDFKSFVKFKGKWVDVETLAETGLKKLTSEIPLKNK